jgi:hypothetical protein
MSKVKRVSIEELAGNLADILNEVRTEHRSVVVEYGSGETLLIKPYSPSRHSAPKQHAEGETPARRKSAPRQPASREANTQNVSAVGAVYDLDPQSITPG